MRVRDVMSTKVVSASPEMALVDAIMVMTKHHISGMPVLDDRGALIGMITEADCLRRGETSRKPRPSRWYDAFFGPQLTARAYIRNYGRKVRHVMSQNAVTVGENATLDQVVELMEENRVKRLPVVRQGKVVGIVSRANLMRALASVIRDAPKLAPTDRELRSQIMSRIGQENWSAGTEIDVLARQGQIDLWGTIIDESQREALKVLVENTPGVASLADHTALRRY